MGSVSNHSGAKPLPRVALVQGILAHYRGALFRTLDASQRVEITFLTGGTDQNGIMHLPTGAVKRQRIAPLHSLFGLPWQSGLIGLAWAREFDALVLMGDPYYVSTWIAAPLARLRGKQVLFWTHGWRRREPAGKRLLRLAFYRLADRLLLYSERGRELGIAAGYPAERMDVIYNSLDLDRADEVIAGIESGQGGSPFADMFPDPAWPTLICTARLTPSCRFDLLLRAAHRLGEAGTPVNVLLVGDGPMRAELERLAAELGVAAYFTGAVYDEEKLGRWLYHADLTVSPGKVGLTAIHSMMYGTPVITHNDLDEQMPEVETLVPGETGAFFAPGNESDLARVIAEWLAGRHQRGAVREACRSVVREKWNPHVQASRMEQAILMLAARPLR